MSWREEYGMDLFGWWGLRSDKKDGKVLHLCSPSAEMPRQNDGWGAEKQADGAPGGCGRSEEKPSVELGA
jgi:hypothetical protein